MLIRVWWEKLTSAFWLLPTIVAIAIVGLLPVFASIRFESEVRAINYILRELSGEGARLILTSIATALMTVVGVLFSITIVVLQQVSSQYSPRVIETFVRSRLSQVVFGFYIGSFVYSLMLVRQIPTGDDINLPKVATAFAILLTIFCFGLLIHYIQHVVHTIKSTTIVEKISEYSINALDSWEKEVRKYSSSRMPVGREVSPLPVKICVVSNKRGYVQGYNWVRIAKALKKTPWMIRVHARPGDYAQIGSELMMIELAGEPDHQFLEELIRSNVTIGTDRTHSQDVRFGVRQLVDIALRGLSPGVNDSTTAVESINGIEAILLRWSRGKFTNETLVFDNGKVEGLKVEDRELADLAFDEILRSANKQPRIQERVAQAKSRIQKAESENRHLAGAISAQLLATH